MNIQALAFDTAGTAGHWHSGLVRVPAGLGNASATDDIVGGSSVGWVAGRTLRGSASVQHPRQP